MRSLDLSFTSPHENLACDEALLDWCEECDKIGGSETGGGILRFWESPAHFVALGYTGKAEAEVNLPACRAAGVPLLRRSTGGGTVLQGSGCLNYALILRMGDAGPLGSVAGTNRFVMERQRQALASLLGDPVRILGFTDLALDLTLRSTEPSEAAMPRKFSGNAQRRRRRFLLFHGTFLLDFDLSLVEQLLRAPPKQPAYREGRSHAHFLMNLHLPAAALKQALRQQWEAMQPLEQFPDAGIRGLAGSKYNRDDWNFKF